MKAREFSKEEIEDMIIIYNKCQNVYEIARKYNYYGSSIRLLLKKHDINTRTIKELTESRRYVSINPFIKLDNETYYWLGILVTDGCIEDDTRVGLGFKREDKPHLIKFSNYLGGNLVIRDEIHSKNGGLTSRIAFRNKEIVKTLYYYGITKRKSFTLKLENIDINYHLLRGIIDGDGSIQINEKRICIFSASLDFVKQIESFYNKENINFKTSLPIGKKSVYVITVCRNKDILKLLNNLYENASVYLDRKQISALQLRDKLIK